MRNAVDQDAPGPLSARQEQLWLVGELGRTAAYALAYEFRLTGPLDVAALTDAVNSVLAQNAVLRSAFPKRDGRATRITVPHRPVSLPVIEATADRIPSLVAECTRVGFDFATGPMVQLRLVRLGETEHVLLWVTHYLVFDPASAELVLDELADRFTTLPAPRKDEDRTFAHYAQRQRAWLAQPEAAAQADWWRRELAGWQVTELPAVRPSTVDLTSAVVTQDLDPDLIRRLRAHAGDRGVSERAVALAAFASVLHRYNRETDLVLGVPTRAPERIIGDLGNLLPVRVDVAGRPTFNDLVARAERALAGAYEHADLPFAEILAVARPPRDASRLPLVQLGVDIRSSAAPVRTVGELTMSVNPLWTRAGTFEVELRADLATGTATVEYATALYASSAMADLLERWVRVLDAGLATPDQPHTALRLSHEERLSVGAELPRSQPAVLHLRFAAQAAATPDAVALRWLDGDLTYAQVRAWVNRLAHQLRAQGVGPEQPVGVLMPRGPRAIIAILAILTAGGAYVPLDPTHPTDRINAVLTDCGARVVVDEAMVTACADGQDPGAPENVVDADNLAYVIYTSGSTGVPKGVLIEHRSVSAFIDGVQDLFSLSTADRFIQFASLGFDVSVFEIFGSLLSGARLYVVDDDERRSLDALDKVLVEQQITVIDLPPALMELLRPDRYPELRVAFVGGEAFSGGLTTRWARGRAFYNGYGPTETTVTVVAKKCEGTWTTSPPIGGALSNHRAAVLDSESRLAPVGVPGELTIAGAGMARGYLGRPDLTAERFRPDPYGPPGSRRYLTGDLVHWNDDGDLVFDGRIDRQVKVRGIRIELGDVESALLAQAGVQQAVAVPSRNQAGEAVLLGYVVGANLDPVALRQAVAQTLPVQMVPAAIAVLAELPLTASGKVDTRALPPIEDTALARVGHDEADLSPLQRRVAEEVFLPLLELPALGPHDDFFALGGSSLLAIRVIPRVRAVFGVEIPVADFFAEPTVVGVATAVTAAMAAAGAAETARQAELLAVLDAVESLTDEELAELERRESTGGVG
ncbi:hypothetical protein GCM10029964_049620 [Kibdelosporangium lantanae]